MIYDSSLSIQTIYSTALKKNFGNQNWNLSPSLSLKASDQIWKTWLKNVLANEMMLANMGE